MVIGFVILASFFALFASALTQLFMGYRGRLRATGFALLAAILLTFSSSLNLSLALAAVILGAIAWMIHSATADLPT